MDESADPSKAVAESPTPEVAQLLRLLEMQTAAQRERRTALPKSLQGSAFRYGSLVIIVVFAIGSIALMEWVISQLPKPSAPVAPASAPAAPGSQAGR